MKNYDVTALGELLIDFTENSVSNQNNPMFEANPGGAPCNVLSMLSKLGQRTAFIGKVGKDFFGEQLRRAVTEAGINADNLYMDKDIRTTLAFVHTASNGDRDFSFYRNPGADMALTEEEIPEKLIRDSKIFHFGTLSMTHDGVRAATKKAVRIAKDAGAIISFDPNLRPPLWKSMKEAHEQVDYGLSQCEVLKISDNELQWFTGESDFDIGIEYIRRKYHVPMILLSLGREGSRAYYKSLRVDAQPFLQENTVETTGAGDTFCACCLHQILKYGIDNFDEQRLMEMLKFANAAASIITTRKGALRVMPSLTEIETLLASIQ